MFSTLACGVQCVNPITPMNSLPILGFIILERCRVDLRMLFGRHSSVMKDGLQWFRSEQPCALQPCSPRTSAKRRWLRTTMLRVRTQLMDCGERQAKQSFVRNTLEASWIPMRVCRSSAFVSPTFNFRRITSSIRLQTAGKLQARSNLFHYTVLRSCISLSIPRAEGACRPIMLLKTRGTNMGDGEIVQDRIILGIIIMKIQQKLEFKVFEDERWRSVARRKQRREARPTNKTRHNRHGLARAIEGRGEAWELCLRGDESQTRRGRSLG